MVITFSNQIFNKINLNTLLNDKNCQFPIKNLQITRTFKYPIAIGRKIFNYNSFSKNSSKSSTFPCKCNEPSLKKFVNTDHGHIITGNLNIVKDLSLKKIMGYGTKFRIPSKLNVKNIVTQFIYDIDLFIYKI